MRFCSHCGRPRHKGLCNMAELTDGRVVHVSRIEKGGDLHDKIGSDLKVKNRWIKKSDRSKSERSA